MKIAYRLLSTLLALLTLYGQTLASGVIIRVTDQSQIGSIVLDYPAILSSQQAGNSPFVRFEVADSVASNVQAALQADSRVQWATSEIKFSSPEIQSGHGSSVAAIYDRQATYSQNFNVWSQINYMPNRRRFTPTRVGIVDTGVSPRQASIRSNVVAGQGFVQGSSSIDDLPGNLDTNMNGVFDEGAGHGTMIAGIILQMVPATPLVIARSADSDGMGTSWTVLEGVVFCVENGAKVINISLGSESPLYELSDFLGWVEDSGSLIISPIGNNGLNIFLYPAGYPSVVCVTGLLPDNTKAPFSNWNTIARVSAPATGILSAWWDGGTAVWSGTSFAAPLVTGSLAAALVVNPNKSPSDLRAAIRDSGINIDNLNPDYQGQLGKLLNFVNLITLLKH